MRLFMAGGGVQGSVLCYELGEGVGELLCGFVWLAEAEY